MKKLILSVAVMLISGVTMASDGNNWGGHLDGSIPDHGPAKLVAAPLPFTGGWGGDLDGAIPDHGPANPNAVPEPFAGGWGGDLDAACDYT